MKTLLQRMAIWLLVGLCLWSGGLAWFMAQIPRAPAPGNVKADAIVVLTGGSGRLEYGLQLLAAGRGKKLFISGVHNAVTPQELLRLEHLPPSAGRNIALGHEAENTIGNAEETLHWLQAQHYRSILLVTSDYHMPRAMEELANEAPAIAITPAPAFADHFDRDKWWRDAGSRQLLLSEYHKYLAAKLRHYFISGLRHL